MRRKVFDRNILFLCEDNGCASQMAEAMARYLNPPFTRVYSAGIKPGTIPAEVHQAMAEFGIDLSEQHPKGVDAIPLESVDLVISFGDAARDCDRLPPGARVENWSVPNPCDASHSGNDSLSGFRACRDAIDKHVAALFLDHWRNVA